MLGGLAYYLIIYPLSLLPLRVLYIFSDLFYLILISIFPYRRKVVRKNIHNSFPNLTDKERKVIERGFYKHLADLAAEGVKNLSISKKELQKRFTVHNPQLMEDLYSQNKSVLLVSGHYNNWEWLITAQNLLFPHQAVGIGMPLTSGFWDKKLNKKRARFGMDIIHSKIVYDYFNNNKGQIATLILADQSPADSNKCYWTNFLNQPSGFVFGPELLANKYDYSVVFFHIEKTKRGHYTMYLEEITSNPKELEYGELTLKFVQLLEKTILKNPSFWLWSHNRWKRDVPENLGELDEKHREEFDAKYRG